MNTTQDNPAGPEAGAQTSNTGAPAEPSAGAQAGYAGAQQEWDAPSQRRSFFDSLRGSGMVRTQDRWIAGVAGGLARRTGLDPLIVRGLLLVLTVFGGLGVLLYGLGWALLPEERDGRIHLQQAIRGSFDVALVGAILFTLIGLSRPVFWWTDGWWFLSLALVATAVAALVALAVVFSARSPRQPAERAPWATPAAQPTPAGQPTPTQAPAASAGVGAAAGAAAASAAPSGPQGPAGPAGPGQWPPTPPEPGPAPQAWTPPPPPKPLVPGPGRATVSIVLSLSLLVLAALAVWDRIAEAVGITPTAENGLNVALMGFGAILTVFGVGLGITAIRGRRGKGLTALGTLALIFLLPVAVVTAFISVGMPSVARHDSAVTLGEHMVTPILPSDAEGGYSVNAGLLEIDLTELNLEAADELPITIPVSVGAGVAELTIPQDVPVLIQADVALGAIEGYTQGGWQHEEGSSTTGYSQNWGSGGFVSGTYRNPLAQEEEPVLILEVVVRTGLIEIREG